MAIDASIALGIKPVQIENPLNNMAKFYNIQNDMQTNQMNQLTMAEAARKQGQAAQYRNALSNLGDPSSEGYEERRAQAYYNNADPAGLQAIRTSELANKNTEADLQKKQQEFTATIARDLGRNASDANTTAWFEDSMDSHLFSPDQKVKITNEYGKLMAMALPERKAYLLAQNASVAEAKPSIIQQDVGGSTNIVAVPAFGGAPIVLSSTKKTLNPDQALGVPVGYDERSVSLQAKNDSLNAKLAEINNPATNESRRTALEYEIQQDRRSISAQQQDQESMRLAAQQAKQPRQELENLLRDRAALVAKLGPAAKNDPVVNGMTARINFLTTHPGNEPVDPRKVKEFKESDDGTIRGFNAYGQVVSTSKPGAGKGTPEHAKRMAALPGAIETATVALKNIDELVGKPEIKDVNGKVIQAATKPHAGFSQAVGAGIPGLKYIPGTSVADFTARFSQIQGGAFLEAYSTLKGGGAITNIEGEKGTAAISRMATAQSEQEFYTAARDFQAVLSKGIKKGQSMLGSQSGNDSTWTDVK